MSQKKFRITYYPSHTLKTGERDEKSRQAKIQHGEEKTFDTLEEVAEFASNNVVSFLTFYPDETSRPKRHSSNFKNTTLIGLDIDDNLSIQQAKDKLDSLGYNYGGYTTFNHGRDGKDKFRIILELNESIETEETYRATWGEIHKILTGIDTSCRDVARFYFNSNPLTKQTFVNTTGVPFPVVHFQQSSPPLAKKQVANSSSSYLSLVQHEDGWESAKSLGKLPSEVRSWISGMNEFGQPYEVPPGERSNRFFKLVSLLHERNYPEEFIRDHLAPRLLTDQNYIDTYGGYKDTENKIENTIRQVFSSNPRHLCPSVYSYHDLSNARSFVDTWIKCNQYEIDNDGRLKCGSVKRSSKEALRILRLDYGEALEHYNHDREINKSTEVKELKTKPRKLAAQELEDAYVSRLDNQRYITLEDAKRRLSHRSVEPKNVSQFPALMVALTGKKDCEVEIAVLKHWMHQVKRRMFDLPVYNHLMINLYGKQGTGKTSTIKALTAPLEYLSSNISVQQITDPRWDESKERYYVARLDELQHLDKTDANTLKRIITSDRMTARELGTGRTTSYDSNTSYIGSSNTPIATLIYDPTGARRFFELTLDPDIKENKGFEVINSIDFVSLWREIDENNEDLYIAPYLKDIEFIQEGYRSKDTVEQYIEEKNARPTSEKDPITIKYADLYHQYKSWCHNSGFHPLNTNKFSRRLNELNIESTTIREAKGEPPQTHKIINADFISDTKY